jgi:hypothetical protein
MASQSVTNKLVANIKQATDVSTNFFTGTNVVCIDTSNRRIGIDTKTPIWSIDISGVEPHNGVKCHNLDISGKADISYALINFLKTPTISAEDINISNGYFKKIDASLIDISEVVFYSISGDFIYSNNLIKGITISGNLLEFTNGTIYNNFTICGELFADTYILGEGKKTFEGIVNISGENALLLVNNSASVNFNSINPVTYITLSGNHINTVSLSCDNLQVTQQADFSSITVLVEASFNTINVSGDAVFSSISSDSIYINGISLDQFVTNKTTNLYESGTYEQNIDIDTLKGKKLYINSNGSNFGEGELFIDEITDTSINVIDRLRISKILDFSMTGSSIILPVDQPDRYRKGSIYYSSDIEGNIDGLTIIRKSGIEGENDLDVSDKLELKQTNTKSSMYLGTDFSNLNDFSCISIRSNFGSNNGFDNNNNAVTNSKNKISLNLITENIIEINATLTVKLLNDNNGRDVDAINYEFLILGTTTDNITFDFVRNTNTILVFDNSFNYNTTSLHYIGKHQNLDIPTEIANNYDTSYIFFGISYENTGKSLELVNFNASIKTIN